MAVSGTFVQFVNREAFPLPFLRNPHPHCQRNRSMTLFKSTVLPWPLKNCYAAAIRKKCDMLSQSNNFCVSCKCFKLSTPVSGNVYSRQNFFYIFPKIMHNTWHVTDLHNNRYSLSSSATPLWQHQTWPFKLQLFLCVLPLSLEIPLLAGAFG